MPGADGQLGRRPDAAGLHLVLPAIAVSVPIVRHRLRGWLATLDWPTPAAEDLEFVLSEAVTNVVEHAYPPPDRPDLATPRSGDEAATAPKETVEILAAVQLLDEQARRVRVEVVDRGRWRLPPVNPGSRGHGLITMAAMTDQMSIQHATPDRAGTTVILLSPPAPHAATSGKTNTHAAIRPTHRGSAESVTVRPVEVDKLTPRVADPHGPDVSKPGYA